MKKVEGVVLPDIVESEAYSIQKVMEHNSRGKWRKLHHRREQMKEQNRREIDERIGAGKS